MNWFKKLKVEKKRILFINWCKNGILLTVEETQAGMMIQKNVCDDSYTLLSWDGGMLGDDATWFPVSGFSTEEIVKFWDAKTRRANELKKNEQPK